MKKSLIYLICALFTLLVIQPNINAILSDDDIRTPVNQTTGIPTTNSNTGTRKIKKKITICIDPANETQTTNNSSKNINLTISKLVGQELKRSGFKVVYTRENESRPSNSERLTLAKEKKADYLLSISTVSDNDSLVKGYSLLTQENATLIDLSNHISNELASINYSEYQGLDSDHYENFPILTDKKVPAILLEIGYISNNEDLSMLENEEYQNKIASAICEAFTDTFQ